MNEMMMMMMMTIMMNVSKAVIQFAKVV